MFRPTVTDEETPPAAVASTPSTPSQRRLAAADPNETWDDPYTADENEDEDDPYIGTTIADRYVVDDVLGEGGMGKVYLAHHKIIGKKVAVKILHNDLARDKEAVGRFVREARAASQIGNPHIVDISDFGEHPDGSTFFVMEYLEGQTLGDVLEERRSIEPKLIYKIALQLCDGLAAAHAQEIVHRDLKPENVTLVTQGAEENFCKILDFGIAKVSTGISKTKLTMAGAVFGTPHYMSPEQAAGAPVDHRTDIYSLGVMLYEMVSGEMPFNADNFMGILTQHMYRAPVPIRALLSAPHCPPGLEATILKCLSKKPDARYQSMSELAADIRKLKSDGVPDAVQEMMARSGSFNVPADYFNRSPQAVVPATPQGMRKRIGPRTAMIAGAVVAIGLVLAIVMRDATSTAEPNNAPAAARQDRAPRKGPTTVLVVSDPSGALGKVGDRTFELPSTVEVPIGETLVVSIQHDGYETKPVALDGSETRVEVTLQALEAGSDASSDPTATEPAAPFTKPAPFRRASPSLPPRPPAGATSAPSRPPPKPPAAKSPGDVVDPWE